LGSSDGDVKQRLLVCKKHDITCFIYWGSLLGTIRHKGYIPWDDDVDIAMKRDDYIRFLEVVGEELPQYRAGNAYTDDECNIYFTRLTHGNAISFNEDYLESNHDCAFAIGIDVFPLYYLPRNKADLEQLTTILGAIRDFTPVIENLGNEAWYNREALETLATLQDITGFTFTQNRPLPVQMIMLYDQLCRIYTSRESDYLTAFPEYMKSGYKVEKKWIAEVKWVPYETMEVPVPTEYDKVLRTSFGDYMVPRRGTAAHGYPYFKSQLRTVAEMAEKAYIQQAKLHPARRNEALLGQGRKVLYYGITPDSLILHSERALEKMKQVFTLLRENKEILLWWIPYDIMAGDYPIAQTMTPEFAKVYRAFIEEMKESDWCIVDESGDYAAIVENCDAFYGDEGELSKAFAEAGKPVMIQDYDL